MTEKTFENTRLFVEMVARKQGWELTRDEEHLEIIISGLMKNFNRYKYFACPCRDASGVKERDSDIICPCDYCRPDQEDFGHCYCGLYLTKKFFKTGSEPQSIPERRKS